MGISPGARSRLPSTAATRGGTTPASRFIPPAMSKPPASIASFLLSSSHPSASSIRAGLQRAISTTASSSESHHGTTVAAAAAGLGGWTLTLERGVGKAYGAEAELQATGSFAGEVFPDLPVATTWHNLARALSGTLTASAPADPAPPFTHYATRPGALKVLTAAANLRSEYELETRLVAAAGDGAAAAGGQRADVLLCVSGSHPVRTLPLVSSFLRSSLDTLRIAERLRRHGYIAPSTQLWVVANPNTERSAALLEAKATLGAGAVLTQPPLDWPAYLKWLDDAERRGLLRPAPTPGAAPAAAMTTTTHEAGVSTAATTMATTTSVQTDAGPGLTSPGGSSTGCSDGSGSGGGDGAPLRLLVGHPMLSSAANLSFWVSLAGCGGSAAAQRLLAEAARAELGGKEAAAAHFEGQNRQLVQQVLERGGAAGLHVMPITKAAKRMALGMLADGSLPPSACSSTPKTTR